MNDVRRPTRRHGITRRSVTVSPKLDAAVQAWAAEHQMSFSAAAQLLALIGLARWSKVEGIVLRALQQFDE